LNYFDKFETSLAVRSIPVLHIELYRFYDGKFTDCYPKPEKVVWKRGQKK